ncbi:TniB family NTP-binding protein [Neptunicella sp. SCSIO 80796]|uniref:TniB family NTP-binding protein n=1 Tax=Neptunicella plasticusilytica TaxID=3117012 RepID=UPI003A4E301B
MNNQLTLKPVTRFFLERRFGHQALVDAENKIEKLMKNQGLKGRIRLLVGPSGTSKTAMLEIMEKKYPPIIAEFSGANLPQILSIRLTSAANTKALYWCLIEGLGVKPVGNEYQLRNQFNELVKNMPLKLIAIDEIQHTLPNKSTSSKTQNIADTIKNIVDETKIPMLLIGLENSLSLVENSFSRATTMQKEEDQLYRRALSPIRFKPVEYADNTAMVTILKGYTAIFEQVKAKFGTSILNLLDADIMNRLWLASEGYIGRLSEIFCEALEVCEESQQITLSTLGEAYDEVNSWNTSSINPFTARSQKELDQLKTSIFLSQKRKESKTKIEQDAA